MRAQLLIERVISRLNGGASEGLGAQYKSLMAAQACIHLAFVFTPVLLRHIAPRETLRCDLSPETGEVQQTRGRK